MRKHEYPGEIAKSKLLLDSNYYRLKSTVLMPHPTADFRELCQRHHLAATHQRQLIYEAVMAMPVHPNPEAIYDKVKKRIPSLSLATVYKNVHTFLDSGVLREVSLHHGSLRVEPNAQAHHHLICVKCKSIIDLEESSFRPALSKEKLPRGFQVKRIAIDVIGVCQACSSATPVSGPRSSGPRFSRPRSSAAPRSKKNWQSASS
jgi:Fur family peroxide stress response transcriptional regulator